MGVEIVFNSHGDLSKDKFTASLTEQLRHIRKQMILDAKSQKHLILYDILKNAKICVRRVFRIDEYEYYLVFCIDEELFSQTKGQSKRDEMAGYMRSHFSSAFPDDDFGSSALSRLNIELFNPSIHNNSEYMIVIEGINNKETETELPEQIEQVEISKSKLESIWDNPDHMRLFISHTAKHAGAVKKLKEELEEYKISSFVAHEDIEPTKAWETEITNALYSMNVFLIYITDDFNNSCWTNQEIGFAYAKKTLIISMKLGTKDPTGFVSSKQAMRGKLDDPKGNAKKIFDVICKNFSDKEFLENWASVNYINLNQG